MPLRPIVPLVELAMIKGLTDRSSADAAAQAAQAAGAVPSRLPREQDGHSSPATPIPGPEWADSATVPLAIGRYRIVARLGSGSMGVVYKAKQASLGDRLVAIKVLSPLLTNDARFVERFHREALSAARMAHANIIHIIDVGCDDGLHYMVMEYIDGGDAERLRLGQGGRLAADRAARLACDAACGLGALHRANLIHRDIKPQNILLTSDGVAKIADLGLCRSQTSGTATMTDPGMAVGTPAFMAPEQALGNRRQDGRCDIYALGATLYTLVTGRVPYLNNSAEPASTVIGSRMEGQEPPSILAQVIAGPFPDPLLVVPDLPDHLVFIIRRATAHACEDRYQTADEMRADLRAFLAAPIAPCLPVVTSTAAPASEQVATDMGLSDDLDIGCATVVGRVEADRAQLTELAREWSLRHLAWREDRIAIQRVGDRAVDGLRLELSRPTADETCEATLKYLRLATERWTARVAEAGLSVRRHLRAEHERELADIQKSAEQEHDHVTQSSLSAAKERERRRDAYLDDISVLRARSVVLAASAQRYGQRAGIASEEVQATPTFLTGDVAAHAAGLTAHIEAVGGKLADLRRDPAYLVCHPLGLLVSHGLVALPHLVVLVLVPWLVPIPQLVPWALVSGIATQFLVPLWIAGQRRLLAQRFARLRADLKEMPDLCEHFEQRVRTELDPQGPVHQRVDRILAVDTDRAARLIAARAACDQALEAARRREEYLSARLLARSVRQEEIIQRESAARNRAHLTRLQESVDHERETVRQQLDDCDRRWADEQTALESRWLACLTGLQSFAARALRRRHHAHAAWNSTAWTAWQPPTTPLGAVPLGSARIALSSLAALCQGSSLPLPTDTTIEIPVALAFPASAALLIQAGEANRDPALRLMGQVVLRALTAQPPGQLRLTLIDPIGLGASFAACTELSEHDDALLGGGILSETTRIEERLGDLVTHLETMIQKRLRGRYASIDAYNGTAGELREALHLVAVADFPTGFSDKALDQLSALVRIGWRCGVHVLVLHDTRQPLPAAIDVAWFASAGLMMSDRPNGFVLGHTALEGWDFRPDSTPPPGLALHLMSVIGREALRTRRVEVPFASVAPPTQSLWSQSAATHLHIPIGKRGADRLQYLDLGLGTAQHALVGGRTGSGKSTLFHVLITSGALWYSPRELEFHLIDFKKGVEFKTFATHRLPHARVVAIESDREFGLSVLRHLDHELARRGELFRQAGAQDLAAHRATGGEHLPRILLLIDEFQEFFTEDDALARDAALLLDRFVRQGRAFGLHIILGSQTLGGAYALAKSSLGQMGIRIGLPCNESDAHHLMHEDNDALRLLTRPGDAIYNDRAGLAEGNSPFQICWLPEDQEAEHLTRIAAHGRNHASAGARPTVVFEGNCPSRIEDEAGLSALLARPYAAGDHCLRAWIGQSHSLRGSAEIILSHNAGANLLIVGQNREAAAATCGAIFIGLAARYTPDRLRLIALDGDDPDGPFATLHAQLPSAGTRHEGREAATIISELDGILERRQSGADTDRSPIICVVFALQRLRQLRPDDDLALSRGDGVPPAEHFAHLLANGPEYGLHVIVWCDALASVQRGLARRSLRDFDARILFQMSAADATELTDDDAASRLGLHTALLIQLAEGRREKFRPFSLPDPAFIEKVTLALRRRHTPASKP